MGVTKRDVRDVGFELAKIRMGRIRRYRDVPRVQDIIREKFATGKWKLPDPLVVLGHLDVTGSEKVACSIGLEEPDVWRVSEAGAEELRLLEDAGMSAGELADPSNPYSPVVVCRRSRFVERKGRMTCNFMPMTRGEITQFFKGEPVPPCSELEVPGSWRPTAEVADVGDDFLVEL